MELGVDLGVELGAASAVALPARKDRTMLASVTQSKKSRNAGPNSASRNVPFTRQAGAVIAASSPSQRGSTRVFRTTMATADIITPRGSMVTMKATLFIFSRT